MSKTFITTTYFPPFPEEGDIVSTLRELVAPNAHPACLVPGREPTNAPAAPYPQEVLARNGMQMGAPVYLTEDEADEIARGRIPARIAALTT